LRRGLLLPDAEKVARGVAHGGVADAPDGDPNMYSFYYPSRYDMRVPGAGRRACDHMRAGCPSMRPDGLPPDYDYFEDATKPDGD